MATYEDPAWHRYAAAEQEKHPLREGFKRAKGKMPAGGKDKHFEIALMDGKLVNGKWPGSTTRWTRTGWWHDVDQYKAV